MPLDLGSPFFAFFVSDRGLGYQWKPNGAVAGVDWSDMRHLRLERKISRGQLVLWIVMLAMAIIALLGRSWGGGVSFAGLCAVGAYLTIAKWREAYLVIERASGPEVKLRLGSPAPGTDMLSEPALAGGFERLSAHASALGVRVT